MNISKASNKDISQICALVNSAYRGDTSRKGWTTEADLFDGIRIDQPTLTTYLNETDSVMLTCTNENQEIIGCVYLKKEREHLYLGMLTVAPNVQAKGIGKLLLKAAEEKAIKEGCKSIVMTVITSRHELINWYKRHGYYETGLRQPFPKDEKFGKPKLPLEFMILQKDISMNN
ncbi:GNAT family N-acetyltransferase [Segetibacter koreensis]|uniref:GNAT family N-acetyltransferase n=1 Tax=Segetibacter koreensis TaxID=398037 RepID=UPI000369254E|nr:GNAT family N-acetyltransferase [Segetibacter koreensis]